LPDRGRAVRRLTDTGDPDEAAGLAIPELLTRKAWEEALWSFRNTNPKVMPPGTDTPLGVTMSNWTKRPYAAVTVPKNQVGSEGWVGQQGT
jgi:hypothetical protein